MENEIEVLREIKGLRDEERSGLVTISAEKENFARSLKNGFGEAMVEHLNNPPKPSLFKRIKKYFKK